MVFPQHGTHIVHWQDQICVVIMSGTFNREGIHKAVMSVLGSWQQAGRPTHWALLYELREWEGCTPEGLEEARYFTEWAGQHGVAAVAKLVSSHFIAHMLDRQKLEYSTDTPVGNFYDNMAALTWLSQQGFVVDRIPALLPVVKAASTEEI